MSSTLDSPASCHGSRRFVRHTPEARRDSAKTESSVDEKAIQQAVRTILLAVGEDAGAKQDEHEGTETHMSFRSYRKRIGEPPQLYCPREGRAHRNGHVVGKRGGQPGPREGGAWRLRAR